MKRYFNDIEKLVYNTFKNVLKSRMIILKNENDCFFYFIVFLISLTQKPLNLLSYIYIIIHNITPQI